MLNRQSFIKKYSLYLGLVLILVSCGVKKSVHNRPELSGYNDSITERVKISDTSYTLGSNHLLKNEQGLWELYVEGNPLERGLVNGSLTRELFAKQEAIFFSRVEELVPSKTKQYFLRKFIAWYNRKMYLNITEEDKVEIYGLSRYAAHTYDYIAPPYLRLLYLHGAHDIGHAMQDLALVGCSSFAAWGDKTADGSLILGRNFDFYMGDAFAQNKIVSFVRPTEGHKFMSVTWGGMIGVVSGMNDQGLTTTINAGASKIPLVAKTPVTLLTREILQYASNIQEAIAIAKKRSVFVSESILVGSAHDNKAIIIEVSPDNFGVYEVPNSDQLICTNHFQSASYAKDKNNLKHIEDSHSEYRYERLQELLGEQKKITPQVAVDILRNKEGLHDEPLGYGNEKALNQLIAHHAIVFNPTKRLVWVSSNPYQLGEFVAYDLNEVFREAPDHPVKTMGVPDLAIEKDPFQYSRAFKDYQEYKVVREKVLDAIKVKEHLDPAVLNSLEQLNPEFWEAYYLVGIYSYEHGYYTVALKAFEAAKSKVITTLPEKESVEAHIKKIKRKLSL